MTTIHFQTCSISGRVDREAGIIRGAAVITGGITARGHDLEVDDVTLEQIARCGREKGRVQVKLNHRDPQALQSICGYVTGFRREGDKVVADWHLLKTHDEFAKIIERAERMPECFGLSAAFAGPEKGEQRRDGKKYARCTELLAVDCVPMPAANPAGLFSDDAGGSSSERAVLSAIASRAKRLVRKIEFASDPRRKDDRAGLLKAAASGAISGGALGSISAFRRGAAFRPVLKKIAIGAGSGAGLVGGGAYVGSKILGKPKEGEGAPYTKRSALGGAIGGTAVGVVAGLLAHKTAKGRAILGGLAKDWRPALWAQRRGTGGAAAIGGLAGGAIGGAHAADEGQQVDSLNSLRRERAQRKRQTGGQTRQFSAFIEDVALTSLPAETRAVIEKLVTAKKATRFVQYGMTVSELVAKADPFNLKNARAHVKSLSTKRCMDEVQRRLGEKFILLLNDRIIDGHHFLAKAERAGATNSLMVLDLTPARFQMEGHREFAVDLRPRDPFGQFTGAAAGGADPNSMHAAYGGVVAAKARRADFIARVMQSRRRVFGLPSAGAQSATGVATVPSVPRIERASEFIKRNSGARLLMKLEALTPTIQFRAKEEDKPSLASRVAKGALIAGAGAAGIGVGARLGAKIAQHAHYRPARPGEDLVGKVIGVKRKISVAGFPVLGVMHAGVQMPGGRVIHSAPGKQGVRDVSSATFRRSSKSGGSSAIYVARDGAAATPEAVREAAAAAKEKPWRIHDNCEHGACRLTGNKPRSAQLRGVVAGAAAGGLVGTTATAAATRPEERKRNQTRQFAARILNEFNI